MYKNIKLMSEGHIYPGETGLSPDGIHRKLYDEYFEMLKGTDFLNSTKTNGITFDDYLHGKYCTE